MNKILYLLHLKHLPIKLLDSRNFFRFLEKLAFFLILFLPLLSLYAGEKENALDLLQKQSGRKLSLISFEPLESSSLSLMVVQDSMNGYRTALLVENKTQNIIVAGFFFSKNNQNRLKVVKAIESVESYNFKIQNATAFKNLFKSIPSDYAIKLEGNGKKLTYIISDPMCPHCQEDMKNIESRLQNGSVILIPVAFMGQESLLRTAEIISKIKTAQTTKQKISLLKEVYSRIHKAETSDNASIQRVKDITSKIEKSNLIQSVPFVYDVE